MISFITYGLLLLISLQTSGADAPESLQTAIELRRNLFSTAELDWEVSILSGDLAHSGRKLLYFGARYAGGDWVYTSYGDAQGCTNPDAIGNPHACSERRVLWKGEEQWQYVEHSEIASMEVELQEPGKERGLPAFDARTLGFFASGALHDLNDILNDSVLDYSESLEANGLHKVSKRLRTADDSDLTHNWWLDPAMDWQPVRVTIEQDGRIFRESRTSYAIVDGRWFPSEVSFRHNGEEEYVISVTHGSFDKPHHARELGLADLNLPPGTMIAHRIGEPFKFWDGKKPVDAHEFEARVQSGEIDLSVLEAMRASSNAGRFPKTKEDDFFGPSPHVRWKPTLWEDYTRQFVRFCKLDVEQSREAWAVLKECQIPAYQRLPAIQKEAGVVEEELIKLRKPSGTGTSRTEGANPMTTIPVEAGETAPSANSRTAGSGESSPGSVILIDAQPKAERIKDLEARLAELYEPIEAIFEKKLKPGLYKLLTPEQKARVDKHDAEVRARQEITRKNP